MAIPHEHRDVVRALRKHGATDADIQYYLTTGRHPFTSPPDTITPEPQEPLAQPDVAPGATVEEVPDHADPERL